ncbi:MAG: right-handed parallel beta-helix repeat-containing protein [Bryobacteraceae bacterium]
MIPILLIALRLPPTGVVRLPAGITEISSEIKLPDGAHDLTISGGDHTALRAAANFQGRAIFSCRGCLRIHFTNFSIDGNRAALEKALPLAPSDKTFASVFPNNGILIEDTDGVTIDHVDFSNITNFAALISHSKHVAIDHVSVKDSGSRNAKGRNNTSGGILLEEGTEQFSVADSTFRNIRGNSVWTHSRYMAPRNRGGKILQNEFSDIGRDAIQVGHAVAIEVADNHGVSIGWPVDLIDVENGGTPVGIDTAGNVEQSTYERNRFEEIDGKCIDLDGFHDGAVRGNTCINRRPPEDYPFGHFGIVFNNANVEMRSQNIVIEDNELDGMKFGGIFLIGTGHKILHNRMRHTNTAHCNENRAKFGCSVLGETEVLETGIYLGSHAEHPDPARGNLIEGNTISGWKMKTRCIQAAPGVKLSDNTIRHNTCTNE